MKVTERQRHALHEWARRHGNEEVAETLMELLPPVGWADVATKRDVDTLAMRMDRFEARMDRFDGRMDHFESRLGDGFDRVHRDMRVQLYWVLGFLTSAVGVISAVVARS